MNRRNWNSIIRLAAILVMLAAFICFIFAFYHIVPERNETVSMAASFIMAVAAASALYHVGLITDKKHHRFKKDVETMERIVYYTEKRKEIDQEIEYLTSQLTDSDISQFYEINYLPMQGQRTFEGETVIDIPGFLKRFGVRETEVKLEKNTAFMLTPFNEQGMDLFNRCSKIMSDLDYRLRQSGMEAIPDKDDILMEIVTRIVQSEIILVNLNGRNANVFYELGIAHALGKPTILLSRRDDAEEVKKLNFDVSHRRIVFYDDDQSLRYGIGKQVYDLKQPRE